MLLKKKPHHAMILPKFLSRVESWRHSESESVCTSMRGGPGEERKFMEVAGKATGQRQEEKSRSFLCLWPVIKIAIRCAETVEWGGNRL